MASIAAGNPPEIALLDNFQIPTWAQQDALVKLDDLMAASGLSFDGIYDWASNGFSIKMRVFHSYNGDTAHFSIIKIYLPPAGLDPEDPPSTIEELNEAAEKLTIMDGNTYKQVGFIPWLNAGKPIYTWGWNFGGDFYDADTNTLTVAKAENIEALQWEVDFAENSEKEFYRICQWSGQWSSGCVCDRTGGDGGKRKLRHCQPWHNIIRI